jgi:tetratricopeptide (TPR) repeat protein
MDWEAPESLVPHWLCEWGVPVTVLALGAIAYALRLRYVYERAVPPVGPWVAVMAVALQNMGDFGSEVPSLGILCSACAGVVVAGNRGRTLTRTERRGWKLVVWTVGLSLAVLSYDLGTKGSHEIALDRRISRARILDPGATSARADEAYVAAALRHPAEPYFAYIRAYRAAYERTPDLLRWVAHTLERDPHHGGAALMLARTLVDKNPAQARDAYRRAATDDPALVDQAIREGLRLVRSYDHALELVPRGENDARRAGLGVLVRALATRMPATTLAFEEALARIDAGDPSLLERRAARALAALRMRMPWCEGDGLARCVDDARIAARDIQSRSPERCHGYAIEAEALLLAGFADAGVSGLRAAFDRVADRADCNLRLVDLAGKAGLRQILTEALDELTAGACLDPNGCVGRLMALASLELAHGNPGRAFSAYERAHAVEPENVVITEGLAGLASRLGRHRQAIAAYAAVVEAKPDRADLRDALKREQRLLTEQIAHDPTALP